ncbi:DUF2799 domain-containing protein [Photobacterium nomapromontoriensis]|uniref:DUF2799 domain-containing protein n=1 Tax=Photobacterium nomapromontoriensis TaxID=2910237 RepID=UPI003D0EC0FE
MVRWGVSLLIVGAVVVMAACISPYEDNLAKGKEWAKLGTYHGEQGYSEWSEQDLIRRGALSEIDYEKYRAGYLQGRFDYCRGKREINTVVNPAYPDDCNDKETRSALADRGY